MSYAPILGFDTSAAHCVASFLGTPIKDRYEPMQRGQAERLIPLCEELLAEAGATWRDLRAIGVGIGPGNFTGIRIAVSAARGLALGLGIPAVGVSGFEMLHQGRGWSARVMISLPATQGRAYVQTFVNGLPLTAPKVTTPGVHELDLEQPNLLVAGYRAEEIARAYNAPWDDECWPPRYPEMMASNIGNIALNKVRASGGAWDERPSPLYIRPADAAPPREAPPVILP